MKIGDTVRSNPEHPYGIHIPTPDGNAKITADHGDYVALSCYAPTTLVPVTMLELVDDGWMYY